MCPRRLLQKASISDLRATTTIVRALKQLVRADTASFGAISELLPAAEHALGHPAPALRDLGCHILTRWIDTSQPNDDIDHAITLLLRMHEVLSCFHWLPQPTNPVFSFSQIPNFVLTSRTGDINVIKYMFQTN
jgi:hypothetical protein